MDHVTDETSPEPDEGGGTPSTAPVSEPVSGASSEARPPIDYEPTGVESVDRVLADVGTVADRPVGEHVAVFERAHEQLRRALDAQPDRAPGGGQGA